MCRGRRKYTDEEIEKLREKEEEAILGAYRRTGHKIIIVPVMEPRKRLTLFLVF